MGIEGIEELGVSASNAEETKITLQSSDPDNPDTSATPPPDSTPLTTTETDPPPNTPQGPDPDPPDDEPSWQPVDPGEPAEPAEGLVEPGEVAREEGARRESDAGQDDDAA